MDSKNRKAFPGQGQFDPHNSTYMHKIILTNGKTLTGYSKGKMVAEMHDKTICLEKVILRLHKSGYFNPSRVQYIEFFYNKKFDNELDNLIVTLFPTFPEFNPESKLCFDTRFETFLNKFYKAIEENNVNPLLSHKPQPYTEDKIFALVAGRFKKEIFLRSFCIQLKNNSRYELGQIENFYREYKRKFLDSPNTATAKAQ
jgi:hypothetical protein